MSQANSPGFDWFHDHDHKKIKTCQKYIWKKKEVAYYEVKYLEALCKGKKARGFTTEEVDWANSSSDKMRK
ncbi:hypothetical protein L6452_36011 [Arctium lappa]|uniref:Uncharacterized protein n=1 Tax=Arctium lappa TaxID=4217 RepID=A0ACB8Y8N4_ARCLA|nr:hypothetical protein L6452_36011 [Arctium lappa]